MATRTGSDLSAFVGDSKDNAIEVDLDNMDASDVEQLVKAATVNGNGKRNGKRKTISGSSSSSSSSTPSSHASNKKRRTGEKKKNKKKNKKKVTFSHSVVAPEVPVPAVPEVPVPAVLAVPAPNFPLFGFVDVAYLVFTVIWTACDLGSLMVEKSPDYESLRVRAFEELRGDEANDIDFPQHLAKHKTELIALVKENNWTTTTDVTLYKRKCEVEDMKGGLEGVQHQTLLFALLVYMDWRVNGLAESKPALFDESKTITECVKGLHFDYSSSGGSAKNYLIETLYVATTGQDLPSHFTMKELGHGLEIGKEHGLKKEKMWKALCDTESSFLRKMVLALRKEEGDKRKAADMFWKGLTPVQQQALEEAATCVSAPDEATCKNFVMPDGKRSKKAPAKCSPFTFEMNDNDEFEFVVPEGSDDKKNSHYVFLERPVEANARQQIEQGMFDEESSDEVIKALYGVLSLVKRVKKGKGNPLRWKESFIDAMNAFVVTLNQEDEDEDDDDDEQDSSSASSDSEVDSDASSDSDSDDDSDDEEEVEEEAEDKGNRP